ncbi:MAG TPA: TIGR04282 family arsenosugar biosynthesis glycosyltransferase [Pirellulales bacterium]|jgi:hypothetical protein|nr:TIGR04282 family arsenosugar biosynthesis glycosyltransferase [Pirellulales bacterium]
MSIAAKKRLLIFTRYPEPGQVKTRLIPFLGEEGAASLHRQMIEHTLRWARAWQRHSEACAEVHFASGSLAKMQSMFGHDLSYVRQADGDLGQRLIAATCGDLRATVIVGTDCPALSEDHVIQAFDALTTHDVVIGPATDGGYYLIGIRRCAPVFFQGIDWGTATVCAATRRIAAEQRLSLTLLELLSDVDEPKDLPLWEAATRESARNAT